MKERKKNKKVYFSNWEQFLNQEKNKIILQFPGQFHSL